MSANSSFSVLHLNIRSLNRNFEHFKLFLHTCGYEFGIICLTETWCTNESFLANSNFQLPNYNAVHFGRENKKGGGVCIYVHEKYHYKVRNDLSELGKTTTETVSIEILNKKSKNVLISTCYRPPGHKVKSFKKHIGHIIDKA